MEEIIPGVCKQYLPLTTSLITFIGNTHLFSTHSVPNIGRVLGH